MSKNYGINIYAASARMRKAEALAAHLIRFRFSADQAERMTDEDWRIAARCAGAKNPGAECCQMVIDRLRTHEALIAQSSEQAAAEFQAIRERCAR